MTAPSAVDAVATRLRAAGCVFAEEEALLLVTESATPDELEALVLQRICGRPLEQVLGWAAFAGLRLTVDEQVFVPRRRTELLAQLAVDVARRCGTAPVVVELCCGVGPVAAAVLAAVRGAVVHAVDVDPAAVRCALANLPTARVHLGDLYAPLPERLRGRVDVLVGNAPYVPTAELDLMPREAREHEPRVALDGGGDGLEVQRRVIDAAPRWLSPRGRLLVETGGHQIPSTVTTFRSAGLEPAVVTSDELGATVVIGTGTGQPNSA